MKKEKNGFRGWIGVLIVLIVWFAVCKAGIFSSYVLPSPVKVWNTFWKMLLSGEIFKDIAVSFVRVLKGFFIAFGLAFASPT